MALLGTATIRELFAFSTQLRIIKIRGGDETGARRARSTNPFRRGILLRLQISLEHFPLQSIASCNRNPDRYPFACRSIGYRYVEFAVICMVKSFAAKHCRPAIHDNRR